jgi:stage II sporulation protein D
MRNRHQANGYDYCDLTHCQLFRGLASRDPRVASAVQTSSGRVLSFHGQPIAALWHSTCAGTLAANDAVFGGLPLPYFRGGPDKTSLGRPWCIDSPHAKPWTVRYDRGRLTRALAAEKILSPAETLRSLDVIDATPDGLPVAIRLVGTRTRSVGGYTLWMALGPHFGWGELKGPRYSVHTLGDNVIFHGTGLGHLVGMCQWGARGRALAGWDWPQIAAAYFPHTAIQTLRD